MPQDGGIDERFAARKPARLSFTEAAAVPRRIDVQIKAILGGAAVPARRTVHPRVKKLLGLLRTLPPESDTSLEALAAAVSLSPGRLMHTFTESIGLPLRPYLQWLKLQRAAAAIVGGMPFSQAAHAAGFADAAHMTRTFKRVMGTTPKALRPPA